MQTDDSVAQLVEHLPFKERVLGSSPSRITFFKKTSLQGSLFLRKSLWGEKFIPKKNCDYNSISGSPSRITKSPKHGAFLYLNFSENLIGTWFRALKESTFLFYLSFFTFPIF